VANALLIRLCIAAVVVVPGWILMAHMNSGGGGTPPPGSPAAQAAELKSNAELVEAARVLSAYHDAYGTFAGANLASVPDTCLVRADAATFCVEAGQSTWLYHLDGSTREDNSFNWGGVKGPCS
jgi:hypothetical protein